MDDIDDLRLRRVYDSAAFSSLDVEQPSIKKITSEDLDKSEILKKLKTVGLRCLEFLTAALAVTAAVLAGVAVVSLITGAALFLAPKILLTVALIVCVVAIVFLAGEIYYDVKCSQYYSSLKETILETRELIESIERSENNCVLSEVRAALRDLKQEGMKLLQTIICRNDSVGNLKSQFKQFQSKYDQLKQTYSLIEEIRNLKQSDLFEGVHDKCIDLIQKIISNQRHITVEEFKKKFDHIIVVQENINTIDSFLSQIDEKSSPSQIAFKEAMVSRRDHIVRNLNSTVNLKQSEEDLDLLRQEIYLFVRAQEIRIAADIDKLINEIQTSLLNAPISDERTMWVNQGEETIRQLEAQEIFLINALRKLNDLKIQIDSTVLSQNEYQINNEYKSLSYKIDTFLLEAIDRATIFKSSISVRKNQITDKLEAKKISTKKACDGLNALNEEIDSFRQDPGKKLDLPK